MEELNRQKQPFLPPRNDAELQDQFRARLFWARAQSIKEQSESNRQAKSRKLRDQINDQKHFSHPTFHCWKNQKIY